MTEFRVDRDFLGEVRVPKDVYWGAQTQRAVENFPISGLRFGRRFLHALGLIKKAAAEANLELGLLDPKLARAVIQASDEVAEGKLDAHFPIDIFQTGSGTSTNSNANEVIANRANEVLGTPLGDKGPVHPNDHVNMSQSSNDVIPSAIHVAALVAIEQDLLPALRDLEKSLTTKAKEFDPIVKTGRTHLMDATPIRLGQEFGGYASQVDHGIRRVQSARASLAELAIGGTAVGTGINAHPDFAQKVVDKVNASTKVRFRVAENHFEAQGTQDSLVEASGALRTVALSMMKIANDVRWMGSGPRAGLGELALPAIQPGSSIMPGKVNPVIPEAVMQVAAEVMGNDVAIAVANSHSNLDLCTMMPVMHRNLQESIEILAAAARVFARKCIDGLEANKEFLHRTADLSPAIATRLNPIIGYERAAELAKESVRTGIPIKELVVQKGILKREEAEKLLDPRTLTEPNKDLLGSGGN
ncbi:MAG TPA: class II fumarate hydratase [Thermoplasmata archaeon]|nr:class II fumarate hydratase [Thermoplasmata archaeon]HLA47320.1 class II fumarate hydratase [Thermoplasmata archaeon]